MKPDMYRSTPRNASSMVPLGRMGLEGIVTSLHQHWVCTDIVDPGPCPWWVTWDGDSRFRYDRLEKIEE
jgi:hypothetical protein